ncbi:MAG TPA: aromatic hydrocarbon degradation protein, partial [Chitinophagaceae bacterium]|nr:aromatic hydrocarbon degradation protein [Chitinophagaceae bacterium]
MKRIIAIAGLICALQVNAQSVDEAIRYSWFIQQGTARTIATGGVMASLGGDIT